MAIELLCQAPMSIAVLLVEPDIQLRVSRAEAMTIAGYDVTTAATFEDGVASIERDIPHVLVAAVRLGLFNGLHLVLKARAASPSLAAVVTAAGDDVGLAPDAARHGAEFLIEPVSAATLVAAIARALPSAAS